MIASIHTSFVWFLMTLLRQEYFRSWPDSRIDLKSESCVSDEAVGM
jgi:hypothetical protein